MLLAVLLRFPTVGSQSYWHDEFVTITLLKRGLGEMLSAIPSRERTPPLYYLLAWFWTKLFGTQEAGVRSLSALFGVATVPIAYLAARDLPHSRRAGLVAAALVAVNPLLVWYSQEARSYALLVLLTALSFWFFVRALDNGRTSSLAGWALSSALALATHYFAIFPVGVEAIWLVVAVRGGRRRAAVAGAAVIAAGAALVPLVSGQSGRGYSFIVGTDLWARLAAVAEQFLFGFTAPEMGAAILAALAVAMTIALLVLRATESERRAAGVAAAIALAGVIVPLILALAGVDLLLTRYVLGALVPAAVAVAIALGTRRAGAAGLLGAGALCALSVAAVATELTNPAVRKMDWRGAAQALGPPIRARVVVSGQRSRPLLLYLAGSRPLKRSKEVAVTEVDLIRVTRPPGQGGCLSGPACDAPQSTMLTDVAPAGFTLVGRRKLDQLTIIRLRRERSGPIQISALIRRLARPAVRQSPRSLRRVLAYFQPGRA